MKSSLLFCFACFILIGNSFSQTKFQEVYYKDSLVYSLQGVAMTYDHGFVMVGTVSDYQLFGGGPGDIYMIRTDSSGNVLWSNRWDLANDESVFSFLPAGDSTYLITGFTFGATTASRDAFLMKVDDSGNVRWVNRVDHGGQSNTFHSVMPVKSDRYVVSGRSAGGTGGQYDMYLGYCDTSGTMLWGRTYGGGDWDWGWWADKTSDGGFIMTGESQSFLIGSNDIYLVKTDSIGGKVWSEAIGSSSFEKGLWTKQVKNDYFVAGYTQGFVSGNQDAKAFLMKSDANGNVSWFKIYQEMEEADAVCTTEDGGFLMVGGAYQIPGSFGSFDLIAIKVDSTGAVDWARLYGGTSTESGSAVSRLGDGYLIGGVTYSFGSSFGKNYLLKTDMSGLSGCNDMPLPITVYSVVPTVVIPQDSVSSGFASSLPVTNNLLLPVLDTILCRTQSTTQTPELISYGKSMYLFPNPANRFITVFTKDYADAEGLFRIFNSLGKEVLRKNYTGENSVQFDVSSLSSGMYVLAFELDGQIRDKLIFLVDNRE